MKQKWSHYKFDSTFMIKSINNKKLNSKVFLPHSKSSYTTIENKLNCSLNYKTTNNIENKTKKIVTTSNEFYTRIYKIHKPTENQVKLLLIWKLVCIQMYNVVQNYLRSLNLHIDFTAAELKKLKNIKFIKIRDLPVMIQEKHRIRSSISKTEITNLGFKIPSNLKDSVIPSHILDAVIKRCVAQFTTSYKNMCSKRIKHFSIRDKKENDDFVIPFPKEYSRKDGSFTILNDLKLKSFEKEKIIYSIKKKLKNDCNIKVCNNGKLYFYHARSTNPVTKEVEKSNFISIDLGVFPFATAVTETNSIQIGTDFSNKISKILDKRDKVKLIRFQHHACKTCKKETEKEKYCKECKKAYNKNKKKQLKKYERRANKKYQNIIKDAHYKLANEISNSYHNVVVGNISSSSIVTKNNLKKSTKRNLNTFSFYKLKDRIQQKCIQKGVNYYSTSEFNTTQCCSCCGNIKTGKEKMKFEKIYNCSKCETVINRDVNSARNILFNTRGLVTTLK